MESLASLTLFIAILIAAKGGYKSYMQTVDKVPKDSIIKCLEGETTNNVQM